MNLTKSNLYLLFLVIFLSCFTYNISFAERASSLIDEINKMRTNPKGYFQKNKKLIQSKYPAYGEFINYVKPRKPLKRSSLFSKIAKDFSEGKEIPYYLDGHGNITRAGVRKISKSADKLKYYFTIFSRIHSEDLVDLGYYHDKETNSIYYVFNYKDSRLVDLPQIPIDTFAYVLEDELEKYKIYEYLSPEERRGIFYLNLIREHPENFAYRMLKEAKYINGERDQYIFSVLRLKHQIPVGPITPSECVQKEARYNASLMLKDGKSGHNAGGMSMSRRGRMVGCDETGTAENVTDLAFSFDFINALLLFSNSPGHNDNMINERNKHIGFAIAKGERKAFASMNIIRKHIFE